jgi:hypothetical protein
MKPPSWLAGISLVVLFGAPVRALVDLPPTELGSIQVKSVNVGTIDTSHLEIAVTLVLTPTQSCTITQLQLRTLHLNGLPVYAAPVQQDIGLHKGEATQLPPITVSVFYRDLYTARPLEDIIEKEKVRVQGELVSDLQVGFLAKLALHSEHPRVVIQLDQDVPAAIGVSALEKRLVLGALSTLDGQMAGDSAAGHLIDTFRPEWIRKFETQAQTSLFVVQSSYSVDHDKTPFVVNAEALGFRAASGSIATSAEMLSPWSYDTEFLSQIDDKAAKVVKNSQEIRLSLLTGNTPPLSLKAADFSAQERGRPAEDTVTVVGKSHEQVHLMRRATPSLFAVLAPRSTTLDGFAGAPNAVTAQPTWEHVLVFRLCSATKDGARTVEPLELAAKRDGNSIRLSEPVDNSVFGSPILAPEGVIGIVQDEWTGTFLPPELLQAATQASQR